MKTSIRDNIYKVMYLSYLIEISHSRTSCTYANSWSARRVALCKIKFILFARVLYGNTEGELWFLRGTKGWRDTLLHHQSPADVCLQPRGVKVFRSHNSSSFCAVQLKRNASSIRLHAVHKSLSEMVESPDYNIYL